MTQENYKVLTLYVEAYSPTTIPMVRLAQYMHAFASLLGNEHGVHFSQLKAGSTQLVASIDREEIPKVDDRLDRIRRGDADQDVIRVRNEINQLLADDNASGYVYEGSDQTAQIVEFPGVNLPKPEKFGPFTQEGTLDGILVSVTGTDQTIHIQLQNGNAKYTGIDTDRDTARRLAQHFFEPVRHFILTPTFRAQRTKFVQWKSHKRRVYAFGVAVDHKRNLHNSATRLDHRIDGFLHRSSGGGNIFNH